MKYSDELTRTMDFLSKDPRTIFLGQAVEYPGTAMSGTLKNIPKNIVIFLIMYMDLDKLFVLG